MSYSLHASNPVMPCVQAHVLISFLLDFGLPTPLPFPCSLVQTSWHRNCKSMGGETYRLWDLLLFACPADFSGFGHKASDLSRRESLSFGGHHPWPAPQPGAGGAGSRGAHQMSAQVCSVVCLHPMLQLAVCMPPTSCLLPSNLELVCVMASHR